MFNKYTIANFEVQNRCVRSATATGTCDLVTGIPEQKFYDVYESLARGNVGLIIQEHAFVSLKGHADHKQLGIHQDSMIQYHQLANSKMRAANNNIKICSQLAHAGPNCSNENKIEINISRQSFKDAQYTFTFIGVRQLFCVHVGILRMTLIL
ncbi:FAD/FMN_dependent oxidoreductase [Hexamita inflata]|uniref:FAD/FMN_dependent oxidoreductase n=1 Tax=Hexamita inflata TaxID=28002 RepID=A0ABP1M671_9EUKA